MKSTIVDNDGNVTCPHCGAKNNFTVKRSGKAKLGFGIVALPLIALAPKHLQCNGCGAMLTRGTAEGAIERSKPAKGGRLNAAAEAVNNVKELRKLGLTDDEIRPLIKRGVTLEQYRQESEEQARNN